MMDKKHCRLIGTIENTQSLQNLIDDLDTTSYMFDSRNRETNTLSQHTHTLSSHSSSLSPTKRLSKNKTIVTNRNKLLLSEQTQGYEITDERIPLKPMRHDENKNDRRIYQTKFRTPERIPNILEKQPLQYCEDEINNPTTSGNRSPSIISKKYTSKKALANKTSTLKYTPVRHVQAEDKITSHDYSSDTLDTSTKLLQNVINIFHELFQKMNERLNVIEEKQNANHVMLKQLTKSRSRRPQKIPECIPFKTMDNFVRFDNIEDEMYDEVIDYFTYLGGMNPIDCAAIYFKHAFDNVEEISLQITWHGTKHLKALKTTRFAQACEEAMVNNRHFSKPKRDEFEDVMVKALKSTKERFRRQQKRSFDIIEEKDREEHIQNQQSFLTRKKLMRENQKENAYKQLSYNYDKQQGIEANFSDSEADIFTN